MTGKGSKHVGRRRHLPSDAPAAILPGRAVNPTSWRTVAAGGRRTPNTDARAFAFRAERLDG